MKKILTLLFCSIALLSIAQTYTPVNGAECHYGKMIITNPKLQGDDSTRHQCALLSLNSTTGGFMLPRMTRIQANAIVSPQAGLQVFLTDSAKPCYYNGSTWLCDVSGGASTPAWNLAGNTGTDPALNFLGTTDGNELLIRSGQPTTAALCQIALAQSSISNPAGEFAVNIYDSLNDNSFSMNVSLGEFSINQQVFDNSKFTSLNLFNDSIKILANSYHYTLPTTTPTAGQVLTAVTNNGSLSWGAGGGSSTSDGVYKPSITDSLSAMTIVVDSSFYSKVGNVVTVSGYFTTTSIASQDVIYISLPIASNFTRNSQLVGATNQTVGYLYGDVSTDKAALPLFALAGTVFYYSFNYLIR